MFGFLLLCIRLPRFIILRQFHHERGGQIMNSGIVRERGPQPSGGQRQLICAVPAAFLKILDDLLDFSGAECAILWKRIALMQQVTVLGGDPARSGGGEVKVK